MMKNNLKETIEFVGLSYTKEMLKVTLLNAVFIGISLLIYFLLNNVIFAIFILISLIVFEVYVQNKNNVYQSFNMLIPYCSPWMKDKIEALLKEIDDDKSVQPFVNFANNFHQLSTHSLMLSIYQMVDQGENTHQLRQFDVIFTELARNRNREMMEQKSNSLANMSTFPLVGAGLITITLTMSILSILGDLINVI